MDSWIWILPTLCCILTCGAQTVPVFTLNPQGGVYAAGATVVLSCAATGSISIVWIQNDVIMSPTVSGGTVTINQLTPETSGSYRCLAVGSGGANLTSAVALIQILDLQGNSYYSNNQNSPSEITVNATQPFVTPTCGNFSSKTSSITYQWTLDTGYPITDSHQAVSLLNGSLLLQYPNGYNNGQVYKCTATVTTVGSQMFRNGYLRINVAAEGAGSAASVLIVQPDSLTVNPGDTAQFSCVSAGGSTPPSVLWSTQAATNTNLRTYSSLSGSHVDAVVTSTNSSNQGIYTCTTTNPNGLNASSTLTVRSRPTLDAANSISLAPSSFLYGIPFTLSCNAVGSELTWLWYRNGVRLSSSGNALVVASPTLADSGIYQCFVYNPFSFATAIGNVTIRTVPATFSNGTALSSTIAFIGQPFKFTCKAQGAPLPTYQWFKDSVILSGIGASYTVDSIGGTLLINNVDASFTGMYSCVATNQIPGQAGILGSVVSSANLTAIGPTVITQSLPANLSIQVGDTVSLPCVASSAPNTLITYNWIKDGLPLGIVGGLSYIPDAGGSIRINSVQLSDAGTYQCTVSTYLTNSSYPAVTLTTGNSVVTVSETPISAVITSLIAVNSTAIRVTWIYSGLPARVSAYLVQVMQPGFGVWMNGSAVGRASITIATVGSLMPFTTYSVQVVVALSDGTSLSSKVFAVTTQQAAPSTAPSGLVASLVGPNELKLVWTAPSKSGSNGIITDYCVQYREEGSTVPFIEVYVGSNSTEYTLTGLKPLSSYEVRVAANTSVGRGPFSSAITAGAYESMGVSFTQTVGFIAMLVGIGLGVAALLMCAAVVMVWKRRNRTKIYRVKSGTFVRSTEDVHLERDVIRDYEMRGRKYHQQLQQEQQAASEMDGISYSESLHTPQTGGSSTFILQAPAYINPPSFEEFTKQSRAYSRDRLNEDFQDNILKEDFQYNHSEPDLKQHFDNESDGDVSIDKPSPSSSPPSDSEGALNVNVAQLEGKMAQAIASGTFV